MAASSYNKMGTTKFDKVCCLIYKAGEAKATRSCRVNVASSRYDLSFFENFLICRVNAKLGLNLELYY